MTKVIILAAGQGTRLKPLTDTRPKAMVPLLGRPLLHHLLASFRQAGLEDITIVGGYMVDRLDAQGCKVVVNSLFASTNMVESLFCAADALVGGTDVIVSYSDTVFEPKVLKRLIEGHGDSDLTVTSDRSWHRLWSLRMGDPLADTETFRFSADGRLIELGKKPRQMSDIQGQYMGLFRISGRRIADLKAVYEGLDRSRSYDGKTASQMYMTSLIQLLIDQGWKVDVAEVDGGWLEVDTLSDLETYERLAAEGRLAQLFDLSFSKAAE